MCGVCMLVLNASILIKISKHNYIEINKHLVNYIYILLLYKIIHNIIVTQFLDGLCFFLSTYNVKYNNNYNPKLYIYFMLNMSKFSCQLFKEQIIALLFG